MVNKRVWNAVLGCNLKNDRVISVLLQGKPFNITVIQVYAPTSKAEETEVEWFYEDLQDLLELTPKKDVLFIIGEIHGSSMVYRRGRNGDSRQLSNLPTVTQYHTIALISHASKIMLKILQASLQHYVNCKLPGVQAGYRKSRGKWKWQWWSLSCVQLFCNPGQNTGVVAFPFSRGSSQPRDQTQVSSIPGRFFTSWQGKPKNTGVGSLSLLQ